MKDSDNAPTGRPDFVLPDGSAVDLKARKFSDKTFDKIFGRPGFRSQIRKAVAKARKASA